MKNLAKTKTQQKRKCTKLTLNGLGVSPGIAIGTACLRPFSSLQIPEYKIDPQDIQIEFRRLQEAIDFSKKQLDLMKSRAKKLSPAVYEELKYLLKAHSEMLTDAHLRHSIEQRVKADLINVEAAIDYEIQSLAKQFSEIDDGLLANSADDVTEVGYRLIRNLTHSPHPTVDISDKQQILIANHVNPSEIGLLSKKQIIGFAAIKGGSESHTAIVARSLGLPAVLGVEGILDKIQDGDTLILDGKLGYVIINPEQDVLTHYQQLQKNIQKSKKKLTWLRKVPAMTQDNKRIMLNANIEYPSEVAKVKTMGADGIGLLRSEFLFLNRKEPPSEEEQFQVYSKILQDVKGKPVTIRTFDAGGEKIEGFYKGNLSKSENPALGMRSVRISLKFEAFFKTQLRALIRASQFGKLKILIPMISTKSEMQAVRKIYDEVVATCLNEGLLEAESIPELGIMIEVPSAALIAESLVKECDFVAIGTNDLTMYTLAADRADEQVAHLYNSLHPAVIQLVAMVVEACKAEKKEVSLCGEIAGDPHYTAFLLGLGIESFSMSPVYISAVKQCVRHIHTRDARKLARKIQKEQSLTKLYAYIEKFNEKINFAKLY